MKLISLGKLCQVSLFCFFLLSLFSYFPIRLRLSLLPRRGGDRVICRDTLRFSFMVFVNRRAVVANAFFGFRWTAVFRVVSSICEAWGTVNNKRVRHVRYPQNWAGRKCVSRPQMHFGYNTKGKGVEKWKIS